MVNSVENKAEGRIESSFDSLLDGLEKLPSTGNLDVSAISSVQGLFGPNSMMYFDGDAFRPPRNPDSYRSISQRAAERIEGRGMESNSKLEQAQTFTTTMTTMMISLGARPIAVGAAAFSHPMGYPFLMALPVSPMMPDPVETAMYLESEYLKDEGDDISIDIEKLRKALDEGVFSSSMFDGDVYRPDWDNLDGMDPVNSEIHMYGSEIDPKNLGLYLSEFEDMQELELDDPIIFERQGEDKVYGKLMIPVFYSDQLEVDQANLDDEYEELFDLPEEITSRAYAETPALEMTYTRTQEISGLPAKPENYDLEFDEMIESETESEELSRELETA